MQAEFVEAIPRPEAVADGRLYISLKYNMTMHRCASGCGQLVPLPLSSADWSFSYDGENISLRPSVGNGLLRCRSHYLIKNGEIVWLSKMSAAETRWQREIDRKLAVARVDALQEGEAVKGKRSMAKIVWRKLKSLLKLT